MIRFVIVLVVNIGKCQPNNLRYVMPVPSIAIKHKMGYYTYSLGKTMTTIEGNLELEKPMAAAVQRKRTLI